MKRIILLHKRERHRIVQVPCEIDFLTSQDEKEACSFYSTIARLIRNNEIFVPDNTLASDLNGDGIVIGVRAETRLICVRVLTFNQDTIADFKNVLGERITGNIACSDGCVVDSRYRGNNLQQMTWFLIEPLLYGKYDTVVATVSPKNHASLRNLLVCSFLIVDMADMYNGYERFVLRKKLTSQQCYNTAEHLEINVRDRNTIMNALAMGYVGYKMKQRSTGTYILFGQEISEV
jgi:hypothetical protein